MKEQYFKTKEEWHEWLLENHEKVDEIWLVYYKKHSGKMSISYEEAVLEALAFGWIDGKVNSIDEEKYKQRFTPRRKGSIWSETNLARVKKLIEEGRMTEVGLKAAEGVLSGQQKTEAGHLEDIPMPIELEKVLKNNKQAWDNFNKFPSSTKKIFYNWINSAKKDETRRRRIEKTVEAGRENN